MPKIDDPNDPDFISEDGTVSPLMVGPAIFSTGLRGSPTPIFEPETSIAFEADDSNGVIPNSALWTMKYKQHGHFFSRAESTIRLCIGEGDHSVFVMDDGRKHCLVSRKVGTSPDGCTYCLIGQIDMGTFERLVDNESLTDTVFNEAQDLSLCSVFEALQSVSNVLEVQSFATFDDVPLEYLPPHRMIEFADVPDGT